MSTEKAHYESLSKAAEDAVRFARKAGSGAADAIVEANTEFRCDVLKDRVEKLKQAQQRGLGLRVIVDRCTAVVYTSDLRKASLENLAARGVALARQSTPDEFAGLPEDPLPKPGDTLGLYDEAIVSLPVENKIAMALEMERIALGYDPRIKRTDDCRLSTNVGSTHLASSHGGSTWYRGTSMFLYVNPLAEDTAERQQSGAYFTGATALSRCESPEQVAREAGRRAMARIGARPVTTQKVPVILHPDIAANWLQNFYGALSGESVFKKTSYLTEKLGATIASPLVTVVDDGSMKGGLGSAPFDGEGVATRRNVLIDKGVCKQFVYDTYWARKAGAKSTGSAGRNYTGAPFIANHDLYIENGTTPPEEIIKGLDRGFYMVDQGAFGYTPPTGNYSYQAAGFWIEKGAIAYPVQDITAASNTLDMLANVTKVGNDLRFTGGSVNAPTLLIAEMTLSGAGPAGS